MIATTYQDKQRKRNVSHFTAYVINSGSLDTRKFISRSWLSVGLHHLPGRIPHGLWSSLKLKKVS